MGISKIYFLRKIEDLTFFIESLRIEGKEAKTAVILNSEIPVDILGLILPK